MTAAIRILIILMAVFFALVGLAFMFDPLRMAEGFALTPEGSQGMASLRSDFPAFFLTLGIFALYGAWKQRGGFLIVPILLLGIAFIGRMVSVAIDGTGPDALQPMVVEAVSIAILIIGYRTFSGRAVRR